MDLLVKLYSDKPSRLAVQYTYDFQAVRAYEALLKDKGSGSYSATLEPVKDKLRLILTCHTTGLKTEYKELSFKADQIQKLNAYMQARGKLIFVHVFAKNNTLMVAKPFRKEQFIEIVSLEMINT